MKSVFLVAIVILLAVSAAFGSYTFTDISYPGATYIEVNGINNSGEAVGWHEDGDTYNYHGFIYSGGPARCISCNGCFKAGLKEGSIYCVVEEKERRKQAPGKK